MSGAGIGGLTNTALLARMTPREIGAPNSITLSRKASEVGA